MPADLGFAPKAPTSGRAAIRETLPSSGTRGRHGKQRNPARDIPERWIAAEQLVAPETRNGDLQAQLMGRLGDKPRIDTVDRRLVHRLDNAREVCRELPFSDDPRRVARAIAPRHFLRKRRLIL